jgi:dTDP-4-dehydrorhamnose 3,5-epimerase
MNVIPCELVGLLIIEPKVFGDPRGFFLETWNQCRYRDVGLHFQNPTPQGKLVSVWQGEVFDVAVDLRRSSPTFARWHGLRLSADTKRQFFIPPGFAHGFVVLSDAALFHYKCTDFYAPKDELTLRWDDPDLAIEWPVPAPVLSAKDATAPRLRDLPRERLFD